jgi:ASC-1-like (ASCH) protein
MNHELKTWSEYFIAILSGEKKFEVRKNDRDYKVGDTLILKEWNCGLAEYTGAVLEVKVKYILYGGQFGINEDFCVMSIEKISPIQINICPEDDDD